MYKNVGKQIRVLGQIMFWIDFVAGLIAGMVTIIASEGELAAPGFVFMLLAFPVAWLINLFVVGVGTLIEKTTETAENTERLCDLVADMKNNSEIKSYLETIASNSKSTTPVNNYANISANPSSKYFCPSCLKVIPYAESIATGEIKCPHCSKIFNKKDLIQR